METNSLKPEIKLSIEKALGITDLILIPLQGGTHNRTFFTKTKHGEFVVRIEQGDGVQHSLARGSH